ncbi:early Golgi alpha-1,2-mannosyltransferase, putative [Candida dubliniensis CD36]|uniref:Early Golgi alpha-1,2-mannosyltransferase, putative n=1 Tax=Candida dubliniensis (strain CD36 / ATCC MYA-646 / CBS 7987 / NCPF 3949 / NRRL Y-17841) TaxID=573826 RepID=B9WJR2_CANDC|nr:early Golgi alpha-1,2-mannosyltransferase, putative [Candida dubliniensis CD36]CAX40883.1 early Golgi alpha-1,2-mannosyltransferase, putative [Candida dubliniensis CD36]
MKYLEDIKNHLQQEITEQYSNEIFKQYAFSFDIYSKKVDEYALQHESSLEPASCLAILGQEDTKSIPDLDKYLTKANDKYFNRQKYFQYLLKDILLNNKPKCQPLTKEEKGEKLNPTYQWDARIISEKYLLGSKLTIPGDKFRALRDAHDQVVKQLKSLPDPPSQFISGHGIVVNGGGNMIGSALTAIANMRERGSQLPVELILDTKQEYDKQICEELLPQKLNGKCIIVEEQVGKEVFDIINEKFSRKIMGLLVSSFDHIIAMDADNLAIKNVDNLLFTEPYLSTKMILWPDLWVKLTSPLYYRIARIEPGEIIDRFGIPNDGSFAEYITKDKQSEVHYHDLDNLPSTISVETGQMVFSKREHLKSLLLALYYNINGKDFYIDLLYQGAYGEGDRETIVPALHVMNERYTLTNQKVHILGYEALNGKSSETTLGQTDPRDNYQFYQDWKKFLISRKLDTRLNPFQSGGYTSDLMKQFHDYKRQIYQDKQYEDEATVHRMINYKLPEILFLHCNHPKIDPLKNSKEANDEFGTYSRRNMGLPDKVEKLFEGKDWELRFHTISQWVACKAISKSSIYWDKIAGKSQQQVCASVGKYIEFLKKDTFDNEATKLTILNQQQKPQQQESGNDNKKEGAAS